MAEERVQRRLAAILAADVVSYSRLMGVDEAGTRARFNAHLHELIEPAIASRSGRIVKTTGDALLVEFGSVVDTVECAIKIQRGMVERDADEPDDRRMEFRIGVNLGDVIIEGDDIHGDGVNVASRLEALAEPGGICVSGDVHRQCRGKIDVRFDDLGEQSLKNIAEPVRVYAVHPEPSNDLKVSDIDIAKKSSIAVLPFDNLSGDPEQDFIGEGLTEDIITGISRIRSFFVIARNSTFQYKGTSPDVRAVARELGVRYVVEGSTRRSGGRIRISVQLIDGATGNHLWAERYDREFEDLFQVQDEITQTIVAQLEPELGRAEYERVKLEPPENLDAWELFHRGMIHQQRITKEEILEARRLFQQAIERDPNMACAYAGVAWTYAQAFLLFADREPEQALRAARRAVELDDKDAFAHLALGRAYLMDRQIESAIHEFEEAIRINPSNAHAHSFLGITLTHSGRAAQAIPHLELALRLSPADPNIGVFHARMARTYLYLKQHEKAVLWARKAKQNIAPWPSRAHLTSALAHLGREEETRKAREELEVVEPGITIDFVREHLATTHQEFTDHYLEGLRKAGLPENPPEQDEALPLPDKPSIAVLPFENMSGDPEQEYFSDGIAEDIITSLSKIPQLLVIARNSSFTYKGKAVQAPKIAEQLGVRYVIEGSVRKAGNRVRITAQLIDSRTGGHLWAERFDRELTDIFEVQDEVTLEIVSALALKLSAEELVRLKTKGTENAEAYDCILRGREKHRMYSKEAAAEAKDLFKQAIELDPEFATAYTFLAHAFVVAYVNGWNDPVEQPLEQALRYAQTALMLDESDTRAHHALGSVYLWKWQHDLAIPEYERAIALDPYFALGHVGLGRVNFYAGRSEEGIESINRGMRLEPHYPDSWLHWLAQAHFQLNRYDEAIGLLKRRLSLKPTTDTSRFLLASCYGQLGRVDEARDEWAEVCRINPDFSIEQRRKVLPYKNPADFEKIVDGLRKAGLPE